MAWSLRSGARPLAEIYQRGIWWTDGCDSGAEEYGEDSPTLQSHGDCISLSLITGAKTYRSDLGACQCVQADALDNGWKPHPERNNQTTGNESWSRSGNVRFKRRQLGGRDGH